MKSARERLLTSTMICGAFALAFAANPAFAQDPPPIQGPVEGAQGAVETDATGDQANEVDAVVVTGSRIPQPNLTSVSPVTVVGQQDVAIRGVTRVEDLVNQLPQVFAAQNSTVANGASGTATVNLRGLGSTRTLVLVNGRRLPFGSPLDPAADLNQIPSPLVERVEILTGGAASIYGSDAVAGVVNFIMQKNFEGIRLEGQYSFYQHNNDYGTNGNLRQVIATRSATNPAQFKLPDDNVVNGYGRQISAVMGLNSPDDRGNITVYASFRSNDEVLQADFDYSACSIGGASATGFTCGGSSTASPGRIISLTNGADLVADSNTTFRAFNGGLDQYNFGPLNHFQRPDERYSLGAFGRYQLTDQIEAYTELMFTDYQSTAQIAPGGAFFFGGPTQSGGYIIGCDNPFLVGAQATQLGCGTTTDVVSGTTVPAIEIAVGRRNTEGGGRQDRLGYQSFRIVGGLRGDLTENFSYDVVGQVSEVTLSRSSINDFFANRIPFALDATTVGGVAVCRDVAARNAGCQPYNAFDLPGSPSAASLAYLQGIAVQTGTTRQQVVTGSVTGDLGPYGVQSPFADTGVGFAFGAEYRRDELEAISDVTFAIGGLSGQGGPTPSVAGSTEVHDLFAEVQIPLAENRPFFDLLTLNASYRFSDYDSGVNSHTYGFGGDWAPFEGLRFRASYARAVRAPNVLDLFTPQGLNLFDLDSDPCGPDRLAPQALCESVGGGTKGNYGGPLIDSPAGQYNFLQGGNPALDPETADTQTFGVVWSPTFVPGLNVTLDYFNIEITELISIVDPTIIVDGCYGVRGQPQNAALCPLIQRSPIGTLWTNGGQVNALNVNIGGLQTSGYDLQVGYRFDLEDFGLPPYGGFAFSYIGTFLNELVTDPGVAEPFECARFYANACGTPNPEYRHNTRLTYMSPIDLDVSLTWRHYGEVSLFGITANRVDLTLEPQDYFDLAGSYRLNDSATFRLGVNNIFDKAPPLSASVGTTGNGNTYPQTYDALGRYVFAGATLDF